MPNGEAYTLLLLFHRTRLLGVLTLLPVMVNILLIDYFYHLPVGVFWQALIHLTCEVVGCKRTLS